MFTALFVFIATYFVQSLFNSLTACLKAKKDWYCNARQVAINGTKREMLSVCKGDPKFKGYSRRNKSELSEFMLARL